MHPHTHIFGVHTPYLQSQYWDAYQSAKSGDVAKLDSLLKQMPTPDCLCRAFGDNKTSLLHAACYNGQPECVELLLRYGASKDIKNCYGDTPLQDARRGNKFKCVLLLEGGGACGKYTVFVKTCRVA